VLQAPHLALARFGLAATRLHTGLIVSGDRFVSSAVESQALRTALPDALAVEMEGAAMAQVCADFGIPLVVLRTVSDRADDTAHVDFGRFVAEVAAEFTRDIVHAALARIPGGSSSGAAVSVALGIVAAALGSDTAGSIRVPAALCGVTGFKSTQSRVPLQGAFPLSHTLDTVCAMAPTVADCLVVDGVIAGAPLPLLPRTLSGVRLVLPGTVVLDALEPAVASAFSRALSALSAAGAQVVEEPLSELAEIPAINAPGGLSAVEAWATHRADMQARREAFDPRVAARIALGEPVSAADYLRILQRRRDWIARMQGRLAPFDALVCPTVPITAPAIEPLLASDEAFFRTNALLLRNTIVANFLDGCSFSLPCHAPGELPVGLMLTAPGGTDARLAEVALAAEAALTGRGVPGVQVSD
jgi:aspartyl-tRNA(Asn)/glutamyl-tRNA(Gln) amidotransferase subunit A